MNRDKTMSLPSALLNKTLNGCRVPNLLPSDGLRRYGNRSSGMDPYPFYKWRFQCCQWLLCELRLGGREFLIRCFYYAKLKLAFSGDWQLLYGADATVLVILFLHDELWNKILIISSLPLFGSATVDLTERFRHDIQKKLSEAAYWISQSLDRQIL